MLVCGDPSYHNSDSIPGSLLLQLKHLELMQHMVRPSQIEAFKHTAQESKLNRLTALSLHCLPDTAIQLIQMGYVHIHPSAIISAISAMAQLSHLRICDASCADITPLSFCGQLSSLHIGHPRQSPLMLTSLTSLTVRQNSCPLLALPSCIPIAQLLELHLDFDRTAIQVSGQMCCMFCICCMCDLWMLAFRILCACLSKTCDSILRSACSGLVLLQ